MATATFNALQLLHVLSAMVVVGYLALVPMWRAATARSAEPTTATTAFLRTTLGVQTRVVLPALGLLVLTGLVMTVGPIAAEEGYLLAVSRMAQAGLVMALVIGFMVASGLGGPAKKMISLLEKGEGTGPAMDKLWSDWRTALLAAALLGVVATGLMVFGALG